jgi:hypothetical protein
MTIVAIIGAGGFGVVDKGRADDGRPTPRIATGV